jgi:poly(A) polymerase
MTQPMTTTPDAAQVRAFADQVSGRLREAGHQALFAGGCVRDLLLGKTPKDYDVATSARPEQVQALFRRTVAVGVSFGVVKVVKGPHLGVEVATFRSDGEYRDGRRPESVRFSDAREDALRRDFTINGMFLDPGTGEVLDFVGGKEDLGRKVIRAIGDPERRFAEDKLRLLRAVRFAARLGFQIDPATMSAVHRMAPELGAVSGERILMELRLLLDGPTRGQGFDLLASAGLAAVVFDPSAIAFADPINVARTRQRLESLPPDAPFALAVALIHADFSDDVRFCEQFFQRLKGSNDERNLAVWLLKNKTSLRHIPPRPLSYRKRLYAHADWQWLSAFSLALGLVEDVEWCRHERESLSPEEINPPPLVTGDDLQQAGFTPGPQFKVWLERIRDLQLDGDLKSAADAIDAVKSWSLQPRT